MRLFSFRKPLSLNVMDGTCVVNDLARNYKYVRVHHPQLGNVLMYEDILIPGTKAYYTAKGKFILLRKGSSAVVKIPALPENPAKSNVLSLRRGIWQTVTAVKLTAFTLPTGLLPIG